MMRMAALLFRAMGDDVRLQIVQLIRASGEPQGGRSAQVGEHSESTLLHHMKILCESGVVACRRQGKWSYYSIDAEKLEQAAAYLRRWRQRRRQLPGQKSSKD